MVVSVLEGDESCAKVRSALCPPSLAVVLREASLVTTAGVLFAGRVLLALVLVPLLRQGIQIRLQVSRRGCRPCSWLGVSPNAHGRVCVCVCTRTLSLAGP